jgi:hypothetical protein
MSDFSEIDIDGEEVAAAGSTGAWSEFTEPNNPYTEGDSRSSFNGSFGMLRELLNNTDGTRDLPYFLAFVSFALSEGIPLCLGTSNLEQLRDFLNGKTKSSDLNTISNHAFYKYNEDKVRDVVLSTYGGIIEQYQQRIVDKYSSIAGLISLAVVSGKIDEIKYYAAGETFEFRIGLEELSQALVNDRIDILFNYIILKLKRDFKSKVDGDRIREICHLGIGYLAESEN